MSIAFLQLKAPVKVDIMIAAMCPVQRGRKESLTERVQGKEKIDDSSRKNKRNGDRTGCGTGGCDGCKTLAKALCEGGLPCAEVTFRTAAAKESIRIMLEEYPEMFVGAGTVLTTRQVDEAIEAGAKFIVSPGLDPEIVDYCIEKQIPVFPGCVTASELAQAVKRGLEVVKFFPAETSGGLAAIKALAAPYVGMKFMPTGGINPGNVRTYLESDVILACGGSWMVKKDLIQSGQFDAIRQMTADAVALVKEVRGSQEK